MRNDSTGPNQQEESAGGEKLETPDIIASNNTDWPPPSSKGPSVAEDFHSARGPLPEHAMYV